ncbi:MAG: DEAD/DEAH box helicase [Chitinophagaceae bacterium]
MLFTDLQLIEPVLKALQEEGYSTPTPIQQQAIPVVLQGRDILGCAQTGTGKTAAFAIPVIQLVLRDKQRDPRNRGIKALVLTPTRELAIQIDESFKAYGKYTGVSSLVIFGGVSQHAQVLAIQKGVDVLVATPGRLLDLIQQNILSLRDIPLLVLDEADRMLDMGFVHDVKKVIARMQSRSQTLFFSATMAPEIMVLADALLKNPVKVEVTPVSSTADTVQQHIYFVEKKDKGELLTHVLKANKIETALVFARTKHGADNIAKKLNRSGFRAEAIHGNKSQNARQRALNQFKSKEIHVLVATDIAARGIDIDELAYVINFELPNVPETYVHRIGRTGRAGANGTALSFCDWEEKEFLRDIQKLISKTIPVVSEHPFPMQGKAPVQSVAPKAQPQQRRFPQGGNRGNKPFPHRGNRETQQGQGARKQVVKAG